MKRITAVLAAVAMLALGVAGPAAAEPGGGKGAKAQRDIVCIATPNSDGTVTKTCTNLSQVGTEDGATETEIDAD